MINLVGDEGPYLWVSMLSRGNGGLAWFICFPVLVNDGDRSLMGLVWSMTVIKSGTVADKRDCVNVIFCVIDKLGFVNALAILTILAQAKYSSGFTVRVVEFFRNSDSTWYSDFDKWFMFKWEWR